MRSKQKPGKGNGARKSGAVVRRKADDVDRLDRYFDLQRREHEAARHIQRAWKRTHILIPWRNAVRAMMAIVTIQRRIRGVLARKLVAKWFVLRNAFATEIQARTRRQLCNLHLRPRQRHEQRMALRIQCFARKYLARVRVFTLWRELAATRIQALWRGCVDRTRADKKWLQKSVLMIQNAMRRKIAVNRYQDELNRLARAASTIQRQFRNYLSTRICGERLYTREMSYRQRMIKVLVAEEAQAGEKIHRLMDRVVKNQTKEKAVLAQRALQNHEETVYGMENDLTELMHQRETLSPRAIEQGFTAELDRNIADYRARLTESKLHLLFHSQRDVHRHERALELVVHELEELAAGRNRRQRWTSQEYDDRRHVNYQRDLHARRRERLRAVAEERRRWQVRFYSRDGKPDKRRRPGRPWDEEVYAGAERATYCAAQVDLLAYLREPDSEAAAADTGRRRRGGKGRGKGGGAVGGAGDQPLLRSVQQTVRQVSLKTYLDEVAVYEQLLDPVQRILREHTVAAPLEGAGPAGEDLSAALQVLDEQGGGPGGTSRFGVGASSQRSAPPRNTSSNNNSRPQSPSQLLVPPPAAQNPRETQSASRNHRARYKEVFPSADSFESDFRRRLRLAQEEARVQALAMAQTQIPSLTQTRAETQVDTESVLRKKKDAPPRRLQPLTQTQTQTQTQTPSASQSLSKSQSLPRTQTLTQTQTPPLAQSQSQRVLHPSGIELLSDDEDDESAAPAVLSQEWRLQDRAASRRLHQQRRDKLPQRRKVSVIPWELLDSVEGERYRFENEKNHTAFHSRF